MFYESDRGDVDTDGDPLRGRSRRKPMPAFVKIYGQQICPRRRMKVIAPRLQRPLRSTRCHSETNAALPAAAPGTPETAVGRQRGPAANGKRAAGAAGAAGCAAEREGGRPRSRRARDEQRRMAELATRLEGVKIQACADECRLRKAQREHPAGVDANDTDTEGDLLAGYDKGGLIRPAIGRYLLPPDDSSACCRPPTPCSSCGGGARGGAEEDDGPACCDAAARVQRLEASNAKLRAAICRLNHVCNAKVQAMELEVGKARNAAAVERGHFRRRLAEAARRQDTRVEAARLRGEEQARGLQAALRAAIRGAARDRRERAPASAMTG